jgi:hypothetical protein
VETGVMVYSVEVITHEASEPTNKPSKKLIGKAQLSRIGQDFLRVFCHFRATPGISENFLGTGLVQSFASRTSRRSIVDEIIGAS